MKELKDIKGTEEYYKELIDDQCIREALLIDNPNISDELLQQSVNKVGQEIYTALEFLFENGYEDEWFLNATIGDVLNECERIKQ
jgi:hypothetical protein